ncbi:hypothetical protein HDU98_005265, partial [Podochytrium sp. JEL0797]
KNDVVNVWKNYTKDKSGDQQRRIENSSWRLWFKQKIEYEAKKESSHRRGNSSAFSPRSRALSLRTPAVLEGMGGMTSPILGPVLGNAYHLVSQLIGLGVEEEDDSEGELMEEEEQ